MIFNYCTIIDPFVSRHHYFESVQKSFLNSHTMGVNEIGDALVAAGHANMEIANCLIMCRPKTIEEGTAWLAANEVRFMCIPDTQWAFLQTVRRSTFLFGCSLAPRTPAQAVLVFLKL